MREICPSCGIPTIRARSIDNVQIIRVDVVPDPAGELALVGDLDDEPTALWNFKPEDVDFWNLKQEPSKHRPHRCAGTL